MKITLFSVSRFFLLLPVLGIAIVTTSTIFPFIVGKYVWFRTSVDLALIFFLFGILFSPEAARYQERFLKILRTPLAIAVMGFTVVFLLACFFGIDPMQSFWSNFERGEGGIQILHLGIFFLLLVTLFESEKHWKTLFGWALVGGFLMALYGVGAGLGYEGFIGPKFGSENFRFFGSIGNPAYTAAYSIFMLFYALYLLSSKTKKEIFFSVGGFTLLVAALLFLVTLFAAATRGAFVGFVVAVLAFICYFVYTHTTWRKWLLTGGAFLILLLFLGVQFKDSPFVQSLPGSRIFQLSTSAETWRHRMIMWGIAWQGFKERPFFGWGPENYIQVFDRHFDTAYFDPKAGFGAWFDRAHSIYFDYLVETGILGFLAYFSIFGIFFFTFFRKIKEWRDAETKTPHRAESRGARETFREGLLFALPFAYLMQGIVLFDVFPMYLNVFIFFAFAASRFYGFSATEGKRILKTI